MRALFLTVSALIVAVPAFAFKVYTYEGLPCYHTIDQMPWTMRINNLGTPDCTDEFTQVETALRTWSNVTGQWYRNARGPNTSILNYGYDGTNLIVWYEPGYTGSGQSGWPFPAGASAVISFWGQDMGSFYKILENDLCYNG